MALTPNEERLMNALDIPMSDEELAAFHAFLEADQEQADLFEQFSELDMLLHEPPEVMPAPDFASKVMTRIEAGDHLQYVEQPRSARWLRWSITLSLIVLVPALMLLVVATPIMALPDVLGGTVQSLGNMLSALGGYADNLLDVANGTLATYPMLPALTLTVIPLVMGWAWMVWFLQTRNRPQKIIIPVQAA